MYTYICVCMYIYIYIYIYTHDIHTSLPPFLSLPSRA